MRVLHLFSNSKWTGPAEPALNLCLALRRLGVDADFACAPRSKAPINKVVETARDRGIEPILRLRLNKYKHPIDNLLDTWELNRILKHGDYQIIHCHLDNDHRVAIGPALKAGIPIVRSNYEGQGFTRIKRLSEFLPHTAWLIEPSHMALEHDAATFSFPRDRMTVVPGAVDVERFDPAREVPDGRKWLGVPANAFVVGIVARMQTHRRFEDFWQAIRMLRDDGTDVHVIVVGRGTNQKQVGMEPVRSLGLEERVHFSGFIEGENYVGMLKAFDVKVYLVPGSDGTCRAVREALAMGKPAVVADRGMLREIVAHGETGYVCDGSPEALLEHLRALSRDRALCRRLGRAAREIAIRVYSLEAQAQSVQAVYAAL